MTTKRKNKSRPITSVYMGMTCTFEEAGFTAANGIHFRNAYSVLRKYFTVNAKYLLSPSARKSPDTGMRYGPLSEHHIFSEMHIPSGLFPPGSIEVIRFASNISTLIRVSTNAQAYITVFSSKPFGGMWKGRSKPCIGQMFIGKVSLFLTEPLQGRVTNAELSWVFDHQKNLQELLAKSRAFTFAFEAFSNAEMQPSTAQALLMIWSGIEAMMQVENEITYRISSYIASFLEPIGEGRLALFKTIKKLYEGRSRAAHGAGKHDYKDAVASYALLKRILRKCIECGRLPQKIDFEKSLFVGTM